MNSRASFDKRTAGPSKAVDLQRFVMPLIESGTLAWRIVIRRQAAPDVRARAAAGPVISSGDVRQWFKTLSARWPKPEDNNALTSFVAALNVLRVTRSMGVREIQNVTPERADLAERVSRVKQAIKILAADLPPLVDGALQNPVLLYGDDDVARLALLASAVQEAQGVIRGPEPPHKETVWHETAKLVEWHILQIINPGRAEKIGNDWNGPMVKIIQRAIETVEGAILTVDSISKALKRDEKARHRVLSRDWVEGVGPYIIAA